MKENRLPLTQLDREQAELLPTREALDININTLVNINFAIAAAGIADKVSAAAGQVVGVG